MFSSCCAICMCENKTLHAIIDTDDDQISWQQKLKSFTAEEFPERFKLCQRCCEEIDRANKFKKQCLEALNRITVIAVFSCVYCNKTYRQKASLLRHISRFHSKNLLKVAQSNFNTSLTSLETFYSTTDNKLTDLKLSSVETDLTCSTCSSIFKSKYRLKRHLTNVHAAEKRFSCNQCNQKFVNDIYLKAHIRYHSKERSYVCTKCGKGFFSSSDLNHHEKIHANIRAYRCDICTKSFNTASDRNKHQICVHSNPATWRFSCTVCARKFPLRGNKDAHERTHMSSRAHCCHLCKRAFSTAYTLKRHIAAHSEAKRFNCTEKQCDAEYKNLRSLKIHKLRNHQIKSAINRSVSVKKKISYTSCSKSS